MDRPSRSDSAGDMGGMIGAGVILTGEGIIPIMVITIPGGGIIPIIAGIAAMATGMVITGITPTILTIPAPTMYREGRCMKITAARPGSVKM